MATRYNYTGGIVTNGLVLNLDAAKTDSYPGTGTVWRDLSGFGNNGTLINGPTFSGPGKQGSIVFDGVNDHVSISNYNLDSNPELSVFSWIYPTNTSGLKWVINKRDNANDVQWQIANVNSNTIGCNLFAGNTSPIASASSSIAPNQWYNVGFTTGGVNGSNLSFYVNGTLVQLTTLTGNRKIGARDVFIGRAAWIGLFYWNGNISTSTIYNRALSDSEVQQNFNALRGRYGI